MRSAGRLMPIASGIVINAAAAKGVMIDQVSPDPPLDQQFVGRDRPDLAPKADHAAGPPELLQSRSRVSMPVGEDRKARLGRGRRARPRRRRRSRCESARRPAVGRSCRDRPAVRRAGGAGEAPGTGGRGRPVFACRGSNDRRAAWRRRPAPPAPGLPRPPPRVRPVSRATSSRFSMQGERPGQGRDMAGEPDFGPDREDIAFEPSRAPRTVPEPPVGRQQRRDHPQQGRLAGPVRDPGCRNTRPGRDEARPPR